MNDFRFSTAVFVAGAIFGLVLIVASLIMMFVEPGDVAQAAQNNVSAIVATPYVDIWLDQNGNYVVAVRRPTPCVVADYVVRADACQGK